MRRIAWVRGLLVASVAACGARTGLDSSGGETSTATGAPGDVITGILAISAGLDHTCALRSDGTVVCWGANTVGQLGNGTTNQLTNDPGVVSNLTDAVALSAGPDFTCAVRSDGTIVCWGSEDLGYLDSVPRASPLPAVVAGVTHAKAVATALGSTCALFADATALFGPATAVATSGAHTCAVLADTTVRCWGGNLFGQLGNGSTEDSPTPVTVSNLSGVTAIATGWYHTCAVLADGTGACWGNNQLRSDEGGVTDALTPVTVTF